MQRVAETYGWDDWGVVFRQTIVLYGFRMLRTPTRMRLEQIARRLCDTNGPFGDPKT